MRKRGCWAMALISATTLAVCVALSGMVPEIKLASQHAKPLLVDSSLYDYQEIDKAPHCGPSSGGEIRTLDATTVRDTARHAASMGLLLLRSSIDCQTSWAEFRPNRSGFQPYDGVVVQLDRPNDSARAWWFYDSPTDNPLTSHRLLNTERGCVLAAVGVATGVDTQELARTKCMDIPRQ